MKAQLAALMSSFIIRKPSPKSAFTNAAIKTVGACGGLFSCFHVVRQVANVIV
jgi:syntaxin 18